MAKAKTASKKGKASKPKAAKTKASETASLKKGTPEQPVMRTIKLSYKTGTITHKQATAAVKALMKLRASNDS